MPEGFDVAAEPEKLDESLIGSTIYMRWETYMYGWQIGKITDVMPLLASSTSTTFALYGQTSPRGRPVYMHAFRTTAYMYGADARLNSWVILEKSAA